MKKITLLFCVLIFNITNAQFTVNKIDGTPFTNGEILEFTSHSNAASELKFLVYNNSSENLDFRIRCMDIINSTGTNFQLCWGYECIPNVSISGIYPDYVNLINAGGNTVGLGDSFKNFNPGDGSNYPMDYSFRFLTRNATTGAVVGSSFNLTYRYQGPLSINVRDKMELMGVKVLNTYVENYIGLEVTKEAQFSLTNLQGQIISNEKISNNNNIDMSNVQSGVYLLNVSNNDGLSETIKIYKK